LLGGEELGLGERVIVGFFVLVRFLRGLLTNHGSRI
jgi:hypothetical protein